MCWATLIKTYVCIHMMFYMYICTYKYVHINMIKNYLLQAFYGDQLIAMQITIPSNFADFFKRFCGQYGKAYDSSKVSQIVEKFPDAKLFYIDLYKSRLVYDHGAVIEYYHSSDNTDFKILITQIESSDKPYDLIKDIEWGGYGHDADGKPPYYNIDIADINVTDSGDEVISISELDIFVL